MRHFPIFMDLRDRTVIVSGSGEAAVAKLRLLLKTEAKLVVIGADPVEQVRHWFAAEKIQLIERPLDDTDVIGATLVYGANEDEAEDHRITKIARAAGILANIVDNLDDSDFITPAIVDRDPVTVAIGTEGAAPVLARKIKADIEEQLPSFLGRLTRIGQAFRQAADRLPMGRIRREFWSKFYFGTGPRMLSEGGEEAAKKELQRLLNETLQETDTTGFVSLVGSGPGDPELLTLKARKVLHEADIVIHDRLVSSQILELARREALVVEVGKKPGGPSWNQSDINILMIREAEKGARIVRLKSGDPGIFGRLDEEIDALEAAGIGFEIIPGVTSASAAAATIGVSLTRRNRNSSLRFLTGHDVKGFAEQDWQSLARPGATAAIYMGVAASKFLRGRLMMHGAPGDTPVTAIENVSRVDQRVISTTLLDLPHDLENEVTKGPIMILFGLHPRSGEFSSNLIAGDVTEPRILEAL